MPILAVVLVLLLTIVTTMLFVRDDIDPEDAIIGPVLIAYAVALVLMFVALL